MGQPQTLIENSACAAGLAVVTFVGERAEARPTAADSLSANASAGDAALLRACGTSVLRCDPRRIIPRIMGGTGCSPLSWQSAKSGPGSQGAIRCGDRRCGLRRRIAPASETRLARSAPSNGEAGRAHAPGGRRQKAAARSRNQLISMISAPGSGSEERPPVIAGRSPTALSRDRRAHRLH